MLDLIGLNGSHVAASKQEDSRPVTEPQHGIAESNDWALAIGRSIIGFARIEHAVTLLIRQCTPDAVGHRAARLDLSTRLAYIDRLLRHGGLTTQEERRWGQCYRRIDALQAQCRTILAYGAPLPGPLEFTGKFLIARASDGPQQSLLTLTQIEQTVEDIEAAHAELVQTASEVLTRLVAEDRLPLSVLPTSLEMARVAARTSRRNTDCLPATADARVPFGGAQTGQLVGNGGA
jgi:hypothetical protein